MRVILNSQEICDAIYQYISNKGITANESDVDIELETTGGRANPKEFQAIINIGQSTDTSAPKKESNDPAPKKEEEDDDPEEIAIEPKDIFK